MKHDPSMAGARGAAELSVKLLLKTRAVEIRDIKSNGSCRHRSPSECAGRTQLVLPYQGVLVCHVAQSETVAEANRLIVVHASEEYSISHPVAGGAGCLSIVIDEQLLRKLAPRGQLDKRPGARFGHEARFLIPPIQLGIAALRHRLARGTIEKLEAEQATLQLVKQAFRCGRSRARRGSADCRKLSDRTRLLLAACPTERWPLARMAREVDVSPAFLGRAFKEAEGIPFYSYALQLRLAQGLDLLADSKCLTMLALDLDFASHSHFTNSFRDRYGIPPSEFQRRAGVRKLVRPKA